MLGIFGYFKFIWGLKKKSLRCVINLSKINHLCPLKRRSCCFQEDALKAYRSIKNVSQCHRSFSKFSNGKMLEVKRHIHIQLIRGTIKRNQSIISNKINVKSMIVHHLFQKLSRSLCSFINIAALWLMSTKQIKLLHFQFINKQSKAQISISASLKFSAIRLFSVRRQTATSNK